MGLFSKLFKKNTSVEVTSENSSTSNPECLKLFELKKYMDMLLSENQYIPKSGYRNRLLEDKKTIEYFAVLDNSGMLNESARLLREVKEMKQKLNFKYIIVDEYQDISRQRFDLVTALSDVTDAKIIAVGDDWQSIYAFSGSDITLFTKFEEKMGYPVLHPTYEGLHYNETITANKLKKLLDYLQKN